ncbi:class II fructose-bisphosphate aldolase [Loigolactobacillus jiayinensis]|uniref:Ketose-bisphosphate aldolase n=1 Tax=Loigolactobacillus jiayinensis TaxID=2486016 RepID=A0ABW1RBA9_9LACO|nr:class II fructose-bisphosphate aldolase [Loigolactobacillus jiayinensis]
MTLVTASELTKAAQQAQYAVGAFNVTSIAMARGVVAAAEAQRSPVILQIGEKQLTNYVPLDLIGPVMLQLAHTASVPVAVHLDHGFSYDVIMQALKIGFSSVMIDASQADFTANVAQTRAVVQAAHALGVSVEAELGPMNREGGGVAVDYSQLAHTYTDPKEAERFVTQTNVDMLAVAYGTVHGVYSQTPHLSFERLQQIKQLVALPLVVHGGSGLADDDYQRSIDNGICKINYYSTLAYHVANAVKQRLQQTTEQTFISDVDQWTQQLVQNEVAAKLKVFGSAGQI